MPSFLALCSLTSLFAIIPTVIAGYSASSKANVAVYWGQNSYGQATGTALAQQRLSYYCSNTDIDIIPLAFLTSLGNPRLNLASAGDLCTVISGSSLFYCSQLEEDITTCQVTYGKTILLSVGGATYTEGGFSTSEAAITAANNIWADFGPYSSSSSAPRPFGKAVVDGFDFDFEAIVSNMPVFANKLRSLMDADKASTGKNWLLTAAPQCFYPDAADDPMLSGSVFFDLVMIQFYNNYCGLSSFTTDTTTQNNFNFATWNNWAKTVSKNPNVKLMLGVPGNTGAGAGYQTPSALAPIIGYCRSFSTFAGVMVWDMSQAYANSGFLEGVKSDLDLAVTTAIGATTTESAATLTTITTKPAIITMTTKPATTLLTITTKPAISTTSIKPAMTPTTTTTKPAIMTTNIKLAATLTTVTTKPATSVTTRKPATTLTTMTTKPAITTKPATTLTTVNTKPATTATTIKPATTLIIATTKPATTKTTASSPITTGLAQWWQCGGQDYTGPTMCASPYTCTCTGPWWCQCQ